MITRRALFGSAAAVGTASVLPGCSWLTGESAYEQAVRTTWREPGSANPARQEDLLRELVRAATLAPSSHNTQCWKFSAAGRSIVLKPDLARRCAVVDPDDHHLFVSLGCAAENLVQAAAARGLRGRSTFVAAQGDAVEIHLETMRPQASPLFEAITRRQSTRGEFDGQPLSAAELGLLEQAGTGTGVHVLLLTRPQAMEQLLELVAAGNAAQLRDPAFVQELKSWIRFGEAEAVRSRDGLFSRCSGNPALPRWLGSRLFDAFVTVDAENDKYARQLRSSAGVAVFVSERNDQPHWVEVGRAFERFALQATALGVRTAHLNQPVEVPALLAQLTALLGTADRRADLVVRFGRGPAMPRSLRRPVAAVLAAPGTG